MPNSITEFVAQRAEFLAQVVLTRRKDVHVVELGKESGFGIDLIAHIQPPIPGLPVNASLGVQVKGTADRLDDNRAANRMANQTGRGGTMGVSFLAPVVLIIFSMEGDRGYWGWVLEPLTAGPNRPSLHRPARLEITEINNLSLDRLFSTVISWFEPMDKVFIKDKQER